jgi:hypothetical protein
MKTEISITQNDYIGQSDFINANMYTIARLWLENKDKKGHIQIFIKPDYLSYYGLHFVQQKRVRKDTFLMIKGDELVKYDGVKDCILVEFFWGKIHTSYRAAIGYKINLNEYERILI